MSLIVAGRFETLPDAEAVAEKLVARGFLAEDVSVFFVNPRGQHARYGLPPPRGDVPESRRLRRNTATGAVAGAITGVLVFTGISASLPLAVLVAGVSGAFGAWFGRTATRQHAAVHRERIEQEMRASRVVLAVRVSVENQPVAVDVMLAAGAIDIEGASAQLQANTAATNADTAATLPLPHDEPGEKQQHV